MDITKDKTNSLLLDLMTVYKTEECGEDEWFAIFSDYKDLSTGYITKNAPRSMLGCNSSFKVHTKYDQDLFKMKKELDEYKALVEQLAGTILDDNGEESIAALFARYRNTNAKLYADIASQKESIKSLEGRNLELLKELDSVRIKLIEEKYKVEKLNLAVVRISAERDKALET